MTQTPDTKPGNYYVSVRRDKGLAPDFRCLFGPFKDDHGAALDLVDEAKRIAGDLDPKAHWYSYGTLRTEYDYDKPGILNDLVFDPKVASRYGKDSKARLDKLREKLTKALGATKGETNEQL